MDALARKRRGTARASITRLEERILKFEEKVELKAIDQASVQRMIKRPEGLDSDFKQHHMLLIETIEEEEKLREEQAILDEHDHKVSEFMDRLHCLIEENKLEEVKLTASPLKPELSRKLSKRLRCVEDDMWSVSTAIESISTSEVQDHCLLRRYAAKVNSLKVDLQDITQGILTLDDDEGLMENRAMIKKGIV